MRVAFEATKAGFDADDYAVVCGVSNGDHYLTFQRDAEKSHEDWGAHLEYADQSNGDYGCVGACRLGRGALSVDLTRPLGGLAGVKGFDVALKVDDESFELLRIGLQRVFRDTSGVLHFL